MAGGEGGTVHVSGTLNVTTSGEDADGIVAVSMGGQGGTSGSPGGDAGNVTADLSNTSTVTTSGTSAVGLAAQSIGGRGGNAPPAKGVVAFAAAGGGGGKSKGIDLTNEGTISTKGDASMGILAHALGGGGGAGGDAFGAFYTTSGQGGVGGAAESVIVTNTGTIETQGHASTAIEAQSIGGGGGSGGVAKTALGAAVGGGGGGGGHGGNVVVNHVGTIVTGEAAAADPNSVSAASEAGCPSGCSRGILAQSIGGGGGNGGSSEGWFSVGGKGGDGSVQSGEVSVNLGNLEFGSTITTHLSDSDGVTAHSIGGGGGNGGNAVAIGELVAVGVGGRGKTGGSGGEVEVTMSHSEVVTHGDRSHGLNAQSIGGGGGNGGFAVAAAAGVGGAASIAVGGGAGGGGEGQSVTITAIDEGNSISTSGMDSFGMLAQSIGGGGGNGGFAVSASADIGFASAAIGIGGAGGPGGFTNPVMVESDATITTEGDRSSGLVAQAIGGGGGNGGFALSGSASIGIEGTAAVSTAVGGSGSGGGGGAEVDVTSRGAISTGGDHAVGLLAQSIGGGGGSGGSGIAVNLTVSEGSNGISVGVGGSGKKAGNGNVVNVTSTELIQTGGVNADGIVAQSIGGSGGNGGSAIAGSATVSGQSTGVNVAVGGRGANGGIGSAVTVNANGGVQTTAVMSDAIVAQSIGGSGGNGGMAAAGNFNLGEDSNTVNVAIGGKAASGSSAGAVTVSTASGEKIIASGDAAKGIIAQSIAGGGGNGGMAATGSFTNATGSTDVQFGFGGSGGGGGASKAVIVNSASAITVGTTGAYSTDVISAQQGGNAIIAQSIAGGGGSGGVSASATKDKSDPEKGNQGGRSLEVNIGGKGGAGGTTSTVSVTVSGATTTLGHLSDAIVAQSISGAGGSGGGSLNYEDANKESKDISLSIGGQGGGSSSGESATVKLASGGHVTASGAGSRGVLVQSIGGNGGAGGSNHFGAKDGSAPGDALNIGIGGKADKASHGGMVQFSLEAGASVTTGSTLASSPDDGNHFTGHAVVAQSIGGSGGIGGAGMTGNVQTEGGDNSVAANVDFGGAGGGGGDGGAVNIYNGTANNPIPIAGTITTKNWNSNGIVAQSIGGGGGDGGYGVNGNISNKSANGLNLAFGASSSGGGIGDEVRILSDATINIDGDNSKGIFAQSIGGGGGNGGAGIKGSVTSGGEDNTKQLTFGLGASGTGGGAGGEVWITNGGTITTAGSASGATSREMDAIFAQSIGGGGGNGGFGIQSSDTAMTASDGSGGIELALGVAGSGAKGGTGGAVTVSNAGTLKIAGDSSRGVFAQSIGGGGGNGGGGIVGDMVTTDDKGGTDTPRYHLNVGVGGKGGTASDGGVVSIDNTGTIELNSASAALDSTVNAVGILAQSIGGGGGNAGIGVDGDVKGTENTRVATVGIGGTGGTGGSGNTVDVKHTGFISLSGDAARGILAQSIGGGGGNGAIGVKGTVSTGGDGGNSQGKALTFGLGRSGGSGGSGENVTVTVSGNSTITTGSAADSGNRENSDAFAVHAQSIGGGGGTGILTGGFIMGDANNTDTARGLDFAVGSSVSGGGDGGGVNVINQGGLTTYYNASHALYAQSIGGGGGHAGSIGGIGTGDGSLTWDATIAVGGSGKTGSGKEVVVQMYKNTGSFVPSITTHGDGSHGIFAQSIGGGGGEAANAAGQDSAGTGENANYTTKNSKIGITLGGSELSSSGNSSQVLIYGETASTPAFGTINTSGQAAIGILAQSVGGGGGTAGLDLTGATGSAISLGTNKNTSAIRSDADEVDVIFSGSVTTTGGGAHGILAQSVGGGGGLGGALFMGGGPSNWGAGLDMGSDGTANGFGGGVFVTLDNAKIQTGVAANPDAGNNAVGILAQSVGGGGGILGTPDPDNAEAGAKLGSAGGAGLSSGVTVSLTDSSVTTSGQFAHGVFAQSASTSDLSSEVNVSLIGSQINVAGAGAAAIIAQSEGAAGRSNKVTIELDSKSSVTGGASSTLPGSPDTAILVLDGTTDNTITNAGTIASQKANGLAIAYKGDARLTVNNKGGGSITGGHSGNVIINNSDGAELQATGDMDVTRVHNSGTLFVAGEDNIGTTVLTGDLTHDSTAILAIDVDTDSATGDFIRIESDTVLDGEVQVKLSGIGGESAGTLDIVGSAGAMDTSSLKVKDAAVVRYTLSQIGEERLQLGYAIDFANPSSFGILSRNQRGLAGHIEGVFQAGSLDDGLTGELLGLADVTTYRNMLNLIGPSVDVANQVTTVNSTLRFAESLFSCPDLDGSAKFFDDGQCYYFDAGGRRFSRDATDDLDGFDESSFRLAGGMQMVADNGFTYGAALAYETSDLDFDTINASSDGYHLQAGLSVKRYYGPWELGAGASIGFGSADITSEVLAGQSVKGTQDFLSYGAEVRAGYMIDQGAWFAKPLMSLGFAGLRTDGYSETGSTGAELDVDGDTETFFYARPAIEFGGQFEGTNGTIFRPKATLAISQLLGGADVSTTARLASAPSGLSSFAWNAELDRTRFEVAAGMDIFASNGMVVNVNGFGVFSENSRDLGASLRLSIPF
ncbi:autotransporter outer membrane beta-barrel domain-containing protein [Ruegeria sp. 2205SS24-7]|uniref:autotransporter outer membrane beta-barrel domain-containing protein n=1 Tax=Ruegeria discodermiae TaxID=3064389 RepID=UPI002740824C|nr:autotransporter outer membrane beta-barrel domain-containing protein [Ruegeria sp. 2205SS24-7]MDP5220570.1 autotransporter outer membrane beta-barrel domain-containing protein [Ruegeria sp. 2205SS24-7]